MARKIYFYLFVFLLTASLLGISVVKREHVEKVFADDYGTYVRPASDTGSATVQQVTNFRPEFDFCLAAGNWMNFKKLFIRSHLFYSLLNGSPLHFLLNCQLLI